MTRARRTVFGRTSFFNKLKFSQLGSFRPTGSPGSFSFLFPFVQIIIFEEFGAFTMTVFQRQKDSMIKLYFAGSFSFLIAKIGRTFDTYIQEGIKHRVNTVSPPPLELMTKFCHLSFQLCMHVYTHRHRKHTYPYINMNFFYLRSCCL